MSACERRPLRDDGKSCLDLVTCDPCEGCRDEMRQRERAWEEKAAAYRASRPPAPLLFDHLGIPIPCHGEADYPRRVRALGSDPRSPEGRAMMYEMIEEDEKRIREVRDE